MQAQTTSPHPRVSEVASWLLAILGVGLLILLFLSFVLENPDPPSTPALGNVSGRIAYFEFGVNADRLWLVDPTNPSSRVAAFAAPHASEFGVIPSISPDRDRVAYTALLPDDPSPRPDSPAGLWVARLAPDAEPRLLASGVDLLVAPVWAPDGSRVVYRRSGSGGYDLVSMAVRGGEERVLASVSADKALFPAGFTPDGSTLHYVALSGQGSHLLAVDFPSGQSERVARISDTLTRDWALSPDGSRMAFLAMNFSPGTATSRAYVLDLASGEIEPVTAPGQTAFSPVWDEDGTLTVGSLNSDGEASLVRVRDGSTSQVLGPDTGFDVPLAFLDANDAYLVRSFEGPTASAPGKATLTLIDRNGDRHEIASGEVTLVGWSTR